MFVGFRPGDSNGGSDHVDPSQLVLGFCSESQFERHLKERFVEVQKLVGSCAEGNNVWFQFGFALFFLVSRVDTLEIGIPWFPGQAQMRPKMVQDLFEPALTGEFLGANFVLVIDVVLLDLDPVVAEAGAEQVGPSNIVLGGAK
jgi:hypothetical protein